jgi:hypothetical protein
MFETDITRNVNTKSNNPKTTFTVNKRTLTADGRFIIQKPIVEGV